MPHFGLLANVAAHHLLMGRERDGIGVGFEAFDRAAVRRTLRKILEPEWKARLRLGFGNRDRCFFSESII